MAMEGKVCLVTGGTSGIGKAAAQALAAMGATVVIVGRDPTKSRQVAAEIGAADFLVGDLSIQSEVRAVAAEFRRRYHRLHVLVNCAGAIYGQRQVTVDGLEAVFALNHLAGFLLTTLLLDLIKASAPARIISVTSGYHKWGRIHLNDLQLERGYGGAKAYGQSKLAQVLFTYELDRRLSGTGVTVNCVNPGPVATNFGASWTLNTLFFRLFGRFFLTPEQGADTVVYLATSPEVAGVSGGYFQKRRLRRSSSESYNPALQHRLWAISEQLTGLGATADQEQ